MTTHEGLENDGLTVIHAPSFAGGRLLLLNRILRALALAQSKAHKGEEAPQVRLVLDENLTGNHDLRLPVQNAHGDVVHLDIPDHGKLSYGSHVAISEALLDSLPQTAELADAMKALLPEPLQTPLESARDLWSKWFPQLHLECIPRGGASPTNSKFNSQRTSGFTWLDSRHYAAMKELGLSIESVLQGEAHCKEQLVAVPAGELGEQVKVFQEDSERHLAVLKPLAEEVDARLTGSWLRLRRDMRSAVQEFAERADRSGRNRVGIRNTRLHTLAQAIRPHDQSQERGLSLMTAIASFQLDYHDFSTYLTMLSGCVGQERVQIPT
jgi:hypothetical protein